MADVLIVCVREDEPQAKALAEMFEAAGFSIGGAPSSDGALRSSGAGVIVWSQASIRSRPFLDASQRVINAGKAVVASLIEPPPPSSIGDSPAFDLSEWDGDPNDPSLDPLFFAVDRMVNATRAAVGAAAPAADAPAYEPPPPPRAPRKSAPPQPSRAAPPSAPAGGDALGAEAEFWRAIRDSRDPADFMDYLARFGPNGAFSEVAELRLKQLTGAAGERAERPERPAAQRTPPRAGALPSSRPVVRSDAAPPRNIEPPPRRMEAPPVAPRRAEAAPTPRRMPTERNYDRFEDREPPRGEGGALRAFVLVALLGAALAGGLYVGGGLDFGDKGGNAPASPDATVAAAPTPGDEPASADTLEPESYSDAADVSREIAAPSSSTRRDPTPQTTRPRDTAASGANRSASPQRAETTQPDGPPPAPVTSWGTGGPLSLTTPSSQPASSAASPPSSNSVVPLSPAQTQQTQPAPQQQIASVEPMIGAPPTQTARPAGSVAWSQRPSAHRISELYPERAARDGVGGRVQLDCLVQSNLGVSCTVATETPPGVGFARAALTAAASYRAQASLSDGTSAIGARTRITFNFRPPQ